MVKTLLSQCWAPPDPWAQPKRKGAGRLWLLLSPLGLWMSASLLSHIIFALYMHIADASFFLVVKRSLFFFLQLSLTSWAFHWTIVDVIHDVTEGGSHQHCSPQTGQYLGFSLMIPDSFKPKISATSARQC